MEFLGSWGVDFGFFVDSTFATSLLGEDFADEAGLCEGFLLGLDLTAGVACASWVVLLGEVWLESTSYLAQPKKANKTIAQDSIYMIGM